jgi:hypothetical protein
MSPWRASDRKPETAAWQQLLLAPVVRDRIGFGQ